MFQSIRFECTSLKGTEKKGVLPPDANGYRRMAVGGLNVYNSAGQFYTAQGARELFENDSSQLMRRVKRGALRGEVGHPVRESGQSMDQFLQRVMTIDERNVCAHFASLELDFDSYVGPEGPIIAIMALVTPSGPHASMLERAFANPNENVCFSIRAFSKDSLERGITKRVLKNVITFDYVNEPGISIAEKYKSPALECFTESLVTQTQIERAFTPKQNGVATERLVLTAEELFDSFGWEAPKDLPGLSSWK